MQFDFDLMNDSVDVCPQKVVVFLPSHIEADIHAMAEALHAANFSMAEKHDADIEFSFDFEPEFRIEGAILRVWKLHPDNADVSVSFVFPRKHSDEEMWTDGLLFSNGRFVAVDNKEGV